MLRKQQPHRTGEIQFERIVICFGGLSMFTPSLERKIEDESVFVVLLEIVFGY